MKVKMIDVAKKLGISKATVSLAVNGKPGVNEYTKQRIFECIQEMESREKTESQVIQKTIKVLVFNHKKQVVCDPELDLWSGVLGAFDTESRKHNYNFSLTYVNDGEDNLNDIVYECNQEQIAGVIFFGTEMNSSDIEICNQIKKKSLIYDYDSMCGQYTSVCIDNELAVQLAVKKLIDKDINQIQYIATSKDIYNFEQRRKAFQKIMIDYDKIILKDDIIHMGNKIEEISENIFNYLQSNKLPQAFITENYQVSIGLTHALVKMKINIPEQVSIIGIDEVPDYMTSGVRLTQIQVPHDERARVAIHRLIAEIESDNSTKFRIRAIPKLINGKSVI